MAAFSPATDEGVPSFLAPDRCARLHHCDARESQVISRSHGLAGLEGYSVNIRRWSRDVLKVHDFRRETPAQPLKQPERKTLQGIRAIPNRKETVYSTGPSICGMGQGDTAMEPSQAPGQ